MSEMNRANSFFMLEAQQKFHCPPTVEQTHNLMWNGKFYVQSRDMPEFRRLFAEGFQRGVAPPISENHTVTFPFFVDVDLHIPMAALDESFFAFLASVANRQVQRFFDDRQPAFRCVVCAKSSNRRPQADGAGMYKHGVHLHWPDLLLDVDDAYRVRQGLLAGLKMEEWSTFLGTSDPDWEAFLDASVYGKGLRMIGAPKATKCPRKCRNGLACGVCNAMNQRHLLDDAYYNIVMIVRGGCGAEEEGTREPMPSSFYERLCLTSVRAPDDATKTAGFRVFAGCPPVPTHVRGGKKRKASSSQAVEGRLEKKFRDHRIDDPEVQRVMRNLVARHHPLYKDAVLRTHAFGDFYKVCLSECGANYCKNLQGEHKSQHVYMTVGFGKHNMYDARMRCWCRCATVRPGGKVPCGDYVSPPVILKPEEVKVLFFRGKKSSATEAKTTKANTTDASSSK